MKALRRMRNEIYLETLQKQDTRAIFLNIVFIVPSITQILTYICRNSFCSFFLLAQCNIRQFQMQSTVFALKLSIIWIS